MLDFDAVVKRYGPITAVDGLTLQVRRGEVLGLLGPNGAGKSTTVNIAVGLVRPDCGRVSVAGRDPANPGVRGSIGIAPQALSLYMELTGRENVAFFGRIQGLRGKHLADRVGWALDFVGLTDRQSDRAGTYSGGMKRRLNLAVALVHDPPLLLLDEPTVGVDPQSRNAIFDNIKALHADGRTIVYTTHYMEEAQRLCNRVAIIDHGRLLALDTVESLIKTHGGDTVVTAETDGGPVRVQTGDPLRELRRLQDTCGLRQFHVQRPDLEQVFLNLTGRQLRD
ncbi:MAG: ABC transporter ATP-binding protein [Phycisphaerales bacterium]|nr:MAG: ABC transporter ATP-binding protein [Phycisphaerales bacterium]